MDDRGNIVIFILCVATAFCIGIGVGDGGSTKETKAIQEKYNVLVEKYQNQSCSIRGLDVTAVEGIKLCMNPETRALYKIEERPN